MFKRVYIHFRHETLSYLLLHHHLLLLSPEKNTTGCHSLLQLLQKENIPIKSEFCSYSHKHRDGIHGWHDPNSLVPPTHSTTTEHTNLEKGLSPIVGSVFKIRFQVYLKAHILSSLYVYSKLLFHFPFPLKILRALHSSKTYQKKSEYQMRVFLQVYKNLQEELLRLNYHET
jgi:hypothetical protein